MRHNGWGSRAVLEQSPWNRRLDQRPISVFFTFRTDHGLLQITDPFHSCRCDAQFFPYESIAQGLHRGVAVGTVLLFFRNRTPNLPYRKCGVQVVADCFFLSLTGVAFYFDFLSDRFLLQIVGRRRRLFAAHPEELPAEFLDGFLRFALRTRSSPMTARSSAIVSSCSWIRAACCSLMVFNSRISSACDICSSPSVFSSFYYKEKAGISQTGQKV